MFLGCITALASTVLGQKLPFHKTLIHHHKLFSKIYPPAKIPGRHRVARIPINMAFNMTDDKGITRRIGNHHPNLWDDDFLQSLSRSYDAPCYVERAEKLIEEIKDMFNGFHVHSSSADDLYWRLSMVDDVERLGIDRHFQNEIKVALDYVYRYWNDKGIGCGREIPCVDLNTTALGFRILRLHRYGVSSDMLQQFKDRDGKLLYSNSQSNEKELRSILNLFRASLIAFPREQALDDVKSFSTTYLKQALPNINNTSLSKEIKFNLEYGWHTNVPRLEARNFIDIYGDDKDTKKIGKVGLQYDPVNATRRDSNSLKVKIHVIWWTESSLDKLDFARHRHVEYYFWAVGVCIEPKYSNFRIGFVKCSALVTYLDDIYDTYGTLDELELFTQAIKRWDLASMEGLPEFMKIAFKAFDEGVRDMAREAEKTQGRDTLGYAHKAWEVYIDASLQEAKWLAMGYTPSLDEYLENGKVSSGSHVVTLQPVLSLDVPISNDVIKEIDYPSRFNEILCLTLRLRGDTKNFKAKANRGEVVSCITCYMKDNPGSTEEDALEYLNCLIDEKLKELNWKYLKPDNVPIISKDHAYALSKGLQLLYKDRDGFSVSNIETKNLITKTIFEHVPM